MSEMQRTNVVVDIFPEKRKCSEEGDDCERSEGPAGAGGSKSAFLVLSLVDERNCEWKL